jgi:hypothetical protein
VPLVTLELVHLLEQLPVSNLPIHSRKRVEHVGVGRGLQVGVGRLLAAPPLAAVAVAPAAATAAGHQLIIFVIIVNIISVTLPLMAAFVADTCLPAAVTATLACSRPAALPA